MNEQYKPNHEEPPHLSDEELVNQSIELAASQDRRIDPPTARMIAAMLHGGQASAMYTFASTGEILDGLQDELDRELREAEEAEAEEIATWVRSLAAYADVEPHRGPVPDWHKAWLLQPDDDVCGTCGQHFSEPHDPECPVGLAAEEAQEREARTELDAALEERFRGVTNAALIRRMEAAEDFGYDDEEYELTRRLAAEGKTWRWAGNFFRPRVEILEGQV